MIDARHANVETAYQNDEIDLFELWSGLVEEKRTIFYTFFLVILCAAAYLVIATPAYKSTAYLLPPLDKDVQEMNALILLTGSSLSSQAQSQSQSQSQQNFFYSEDVFNKFLVNLSSRNLKKELFDKYQLEKIYAPNLSKKYSVEEKKALLNQALEKFSKDFTIVYPKQKDKDVEVSFSLTLETTPEAVSKAVNEAVDIASKQTIEQIYQGILSEYNVRLDQLNNRIDSLRKTAKDRRLDRIAKLDEAVNIAKKLHIVEPKQIGQSVTVNTEKGSGSQSVPLYFFGYKLLEAEKNALESRENDDPFIEGLRSLQEQLTQLESLSINEKAFGVVRVDQSAFPATMPEKPKKVLVFVIAGVLGLMLGVMIALVRRAYRNRKEQQDVQLTV